MTAKKATTKKPATRKTTKKPTAKKVAEPKLPDGAKLAKDLKGNFYHLYDERTRTGTPKKVGEYISDAPVAHGSSIKHGGTSMKVHSVDGDKLFVK
jgi:hypothetical protein